MPVSGILAAIRACSDSASGVRVVVVGRRGGKDGCGVWVWEGGRRALMREVAAVREWGPIGGGGGSMSGWLVLVLVWGRV